MGPEPRSNLTLILGLLYALLCLCIALFALRAAVDNNNIMASPIADIITLDNFVDKLPKWHPDDASHLHALVDMGSNGIRFSISDLSPPRTRLLPCVYRERAGISLFDALMAVDSTGYSGSSRASSPPTLTLPDETIKQVACTLARFRRIALDYGVAPDRMAVFATEAMRRAANAGALLEAIAVAAPGLSVHVLAPEVETLFGSTGARSGFAVVGNSDTGTGGLMLDLGGGSVQMTYVDPRLGPGYEVAAARAGQSMPYGAARLTRLVKSAAAASASVDAGSEQQFGEKRHDAERIRLVAEAKAEADARAMAEAAPRLADDMTAALARLHETFPSLLQLQKHKRNKTSDGVIDVYLCGGGFRGYGSMLMHNDAVQPYPVPLMGGYTVPGAFFRDTHGMRRANHELADGKIFGMSKRRRQQFAAITAVVDALLVALQRSNHTIRSVTFCAGGNREGALMMRLPPALREADPLAILVETAATSSLYSRSRSGKDVVAAIEASANALLSALPPSASSLSQPSWAPLQPVLALLATHIWERTGADSSANAAFVLHDAVVRNPGMPGLTHQARAVLAVSLWARWGGGVAPTDTPLLEGLRQLLDRSSGRNSSAASDDDLTFWAEYIGGVAAILALVFPAGPPSANEVAASVRFQPSLSATKSGKKMVVQLNVAVAASRAVGLDLAEELPGCFASVGKLHKESIKIKVHAEEF